MPRVLPDPTACEGLARFRATFLRTKNFFGFFYCSFSENRRVFARNGISVSEKNENESKNEPIKTEIKKEKNKKQSNWAIAPQKHRKILQMLRAGKSVWQVAMELGVGVRTVQRRKLIVEAEADRGIARDDGCDVRDVISFRRVKWNCPVHGPVDFRPCVICTTQAAMRRTNPSQN